MQVQKKEKYMTFEKALEVVKELSKSQGFYCRQLLDMLSYDDIQKMEFENDLEMKKVKTDLDLIYYFEC